MKDNDDDNKSKEEGETESEEDEWETSWEASLEILNNTKIAKSDNRQKSDSAKIEKSAATRGRGRKKFDDETLIGTSHPDMETTKSISSSPNLSTNSTNEEEGEGEAITSSDRADAQKQYSHVLEIHSFPQTTTTENLDELLKDYATMYRLKWVNDTSAVVIFRSPKFAADALTRFGNSKYKMRPISEASNESLAIACRHLARKIEEKSTPRPYQTTTTVARRLIANALNMNFKPAAGDSHLNPSQIREAKRRIWDDDNA